MRFCGINQISVALKPKQIRTGARHLELRCSSEIIPLAFVLAMQQVAAWGLRYRLATLHHVAEDLFCTVANSHYVAGD
jgi:hypothetical protein